MDYRIELSSTSSLLVNEVLVQTIAMLVRSLTAQSH